MSPQIELHPVTGACRHLRGRYKLQTSHKSPFPERRLISYECELGLDITGDEEVEKCSEPRVECWKKEVTA
jgi:hypothetical protein